MDKKYKIKNFHKFNYKSLIVKKYLKMILKKILK